jgi:hypothetical protein
MECEDQGERERVEWEGERLRLEGVHVWEEDPYEKRVHRFQR